MTGGLDPVSGLQRAAQAFLARLQAGATEPVAAFLQRHAELREWLEPMLAEDPAAVVDGDGGHAAAATASLGPFRLLREIGRGGMGVVHEARRGADDEPLALKVLPGFLAAQAGRSERFAREADLAGRLAHPGLVRVVDAGAAGDTPWLALEYVAGAPLDAVLAALAAVPPAELTAEALGAAVVAHQHVPTGTSPAAATGFVGSYVAAVARLALQLAEALAHLHAHGILHRDVKPSNVLVTPAGRVVLTDFGLAREVEGASLTLTGDFAGTPNYVSPEQAMAKRVHVDHRSDLFSLGSTLYELLTLQKAFPGDSTPEVLGRILTKEPLPPTRWHPGLPGDLLAIVGKLLEKDPDRRYADAASLVADLRAFLEYRPVAAQRASTLTRVIRWTRREPLRASLVAVLAVTLPTLAAGAGYLWARRDEIREGRERILAREVEAAIDAGYLAWILEDPALAHDQFTKALASDATSEAAAVGLVLALLRRDGPEAALQRLQAELLPNLSATLADLLQYSLLNRLGRPEAPALLPRLRQPVTAFEWFVRGILEHDGAGHTGQRLLDDIDRAVGASERPRLWLHLHQAAYAEAAGDAAAGRRAASSLLAHWPESPVARHFACLALRRVEPERALRLADELCEQHPGDGLGPWAKGLVLEARGDRPGATAALERATACLPRSPAAHYTLGKLWFDRGEPARALALMTQARDLSPRFVEAWMGIGMAQRRLGHVDEALAALQRAVELHESQGDARFQLGQLLVQRGDTAAGLEQLRRATQLSGADPNKWHHLAFALFTTGDDVGGEAALRRAVKVAPRYERGHSVLVMFLLERGSAAAVREALAAWVEALPESVEGWLQYGQHCLRPDLDGALGDPAQAVWAGARVVALTGERSGAGWLLLGEARQRLGQDELARQAWQQALAAASPLAPAARARCEQLLAALPAAAGGGR
jgi:serine/threonine protein kinase/Flp pilus assembly protein TadD